MNRLLILYLTIIFVIASIVVAEIPNAINYQGRLTNADGSPVADGNYEVTFAIYDQAIEGTELWSCPPQNVSISKGLFTYQLGSDTTFPNGLFESDTLRWLGIEVGGEQITPRTKLTSVAYAYHSLSADTATYALSGSGGWVDNGTIVALATPSDSVGIGTLNPQGRLDVTGDARFKREDGPGDQIVMNVSSGPVGLQLRSGTTGGTPLIDFANDDTTDFDARMVLVADSAMWLYGKPYVNLKLAGNLLVERTQSNGTDATEELDGIRSYYTYQGTHIKVSQQTPIRIRDLRFMRPL
jgi:hypothetical protein